MEQEGKSYLRRIFNIQSGTDRAGTIKEISDNITLTGNNIWMLGCSTMLACLGLDLNSSAVLIGAMLVSPLMGPIMGAGLSFGTNDREMLSRTMRNLAVATIVSLLVSSLYFALTPFGEPTNEILSRTEPTLLDVMVAFFGGVAGIVSNSREEKSNAIPGVAIATALMPPVCVAGYGIANLNWGIFFGAFYLYFINALFISLATYLIVRFLHFPFKKYTDQSARKRTAGYMTLFLVIAVLPSIYFLYNIYNEISTKKKIENLLVHNIEKAGNQVIKLEVVDRDSFKTINLIFAGREIPDERRIAYEDTLRQNGLKNYRLNPMRLNITEDEIQEASLKITKEELKLFEREHMKSNKKPDTVYLKPKPDYIQLFSEVKIAFPQVEEMGLGEMGFLRRDSSGTKLDTLTTVSLKVKKFKNAREDQKEKDRLYAYLKVKLKKDTLQLVSQP